MISLMTWRRGLIVLAIAALIAVFFAAGLQQYFTLEAIQSQQDRLENYRSAHPFIAAAAAFGGYVAMALLMIPGTVFLTLLIGALFGPLWGTVIVVLAGSIGASGSFLIARHLLRDGLQHRFGRQLATIDCGIERDGVFYLLTLRLMPIFSYVLINLLLGITRMRLVTFATGTLIGMVPGTLAYVYAGQQLGQLRSASDVLSPALLGALIALGLLPLTAKLALTKFQAWRATA